MLQIVSLPASGWGFDDKKEKVTNRINRGLHISGRHIPMLIPGSLSCGRSKTRGVAKWINPSPSNAFAWFDLAAEFWMDRRYRWN